MAFPTPPTHVAAGAAAKGDSAAINAENFRFLRDYIQRESGILPGDGKLYLVQARLNPLLTAEKLPSLDDLCARLRGTPGADLRRRIVESMTTHETLFFRDPDVFEALRKQSFADRRPNRCGSPLTGAIFYAGAWNRVLLVECCEHQARLWSSLLMGISEPAPDDVRDGLG